MLREKNWLWLLSSSLDLIVFTLSQSEVEAASILGFPRIVAWKRFCPLPVSLSQSTRVSHSAVGMNLHCYDISHMTDPLITQWQWIQQVFLLFLRLLAAVSSHVANFTKLSSVVRDATRLISHYWYRLLVSPIRKANIILFTLYCTAPVAPLWEFRNLKCKFLTYLPLWFVLCYTRTTSCIPALMMILSLPDAYLTSLNLSPDIWNVPSGKLP